VSADQHHQTSYRVDRISAPVAARIAEVILLSCLLSGLPVRVRLRHGKPSLGATSHWRAGTNRKSQPVRVCDWRKAKRKTCRGDNRKRWRLFERIKAGAQPAPDAGPQMREGLS